MSDFAALLAEAEFVDKDARTDYTGPIDPAVVSIVDTCVSGGKRATIPVPSLDVFDALAEQLAAQARKLDKTAHITKVWADDEKTVIQALRVGVGAKRGRTAAEKPANEAAPAESK